MASLSFDALPPDMAQALLHRCLPVPRWIDEVIAGRPYGSREALLKAAAIAAQHLDDEELAAALAGHPRIGERASDPAHERAHSEREQSGVDSADVDVMRRLADGNAAYERRFDRVFLIRAAGRSGSDILSELERRLDNDDAAEREETVAQLREIALHRLGEEV